MLITLSMKHFRRHEALEINFVQGLNALRGSNEAGKSTVIEAALYALYGSKALRDTLAETVTWGHPEKDLAVKLVLRVRGTLYSFTRSKGGAECRGDDGVVVTGQAEVSAYAAELLGADAKTASLLMLASQSGLRGALDDGPAAVSGLMAKLADFDVIDKILKAGEENLQLGSTAPLADRITQAEQRAQSLLESAPSPEQESVLRAAADAYAEGVTKLTQLEEEKLQPALAAAQLDLEAARRHNDALLDEQDRLAQMRQRIANLDGQRKAALAEVTAAPGKAVIEALRKDAQGEIDHDKVLAAYRKFLSVSYPDNYWEGDMASFEADLAEAKRHLEACQAEISRLEGERRSLQGQKITNGKCPTCGHAARSDEHVAAHNAEVDEKIAAVNAKLVAAGPGLQAARVGVEARERIARQHREMQSALAPILQHLEQDQNQVPWKPTWRGEPPAQEASTKARTALQHAEAKQRAADQANGRLETLVAQVEALERDAAALEERLKATERKDLSMLQQALDAAYAAYSANAAALREAKQHKVAADAALVQHQATVKAVQEGVAQARQQVQEYQLMIREIDFNNALMAALKKIKPAITDHLWNTVLSAVSTFFSQMRGEPSLVTKDKDGFKVNEKSVDSLSGSTIDVLALAVRVALTKTFIPHASFMVLDEPFSACDNDRTGSGLAFVAGCGFDQLIMASHDPISEAVSDHVISIGA